MGLAECTDIILNRTIRSLGHQQLYCCLPSLLLLCPHTVQPSLTILFCDNLYFSDNALLQSIHSWQHLFSLRIHPYLFPDYPSIHDTTCSPRIHPYLFPDDPSIPNNTCILWQSIHSWQHLFSQNSSTFVPWLPIHSWQHLHSVTIHSFLTKHFYCLTIHPLLATIILSEFDTPSAVDNMGSVTVHPLLGPLLYHGRVSRCLRGWAGVCRRFPFGTGRFIIAVHCPFLAGRLKQNARHDNWNAQLLHTKIHSHYHCLHKVIT